jgi:hypothetical protein
MDGNIVIANASQTREASLIFCYIGVPNVEDCRARRLRGIESMRSVALSGEVGSVRGRRRVNGMTSSDSK